jgi:hypothetical protein
VLAWSVLFFPVALALLQSALNRSGGAEVPGEAVVA